MCWSPTTVRSRSPARLAREGAVDLTAGGSIVELTGGQIAASILTAKSTGGLDLSGANEFSVLVVTNDGGAASVNNLADLDIAGMSQLPAVTCGYPTTERS